MSRPAGCGRVSRRDGRPVVPAWSFALTTDTTASLSREPQCLF